MKTLYRHVIEEMRGKLDDLERNVRDESEGDAIYHARDVEHTADMLRAAIESDGRYQRSAGR